MNTLTRGLLVLLVICSCSDGHVQPSSTHPHTEYRMLPDLLTSLLPSHLDNQQLVISSTQQRDLLLDRLAPEHGENAATWRQSILLTFAASHLDFQEEAVVLVQRVFGTGMAKASLMLSGPQNRTVSATITVRWPKGPATPDIGSSQFAFAVKRSSVDRVQILMAGAPAITLPIAP